VTDRGISHLLQSHRQCDEGTKSQFLAAVVIVLGFVVVMDYSGKCAILSTIWTTFSRNDTRGWCSCAGVRSFYLSSMNMFIRTWRWMSYQLLLISLFSFSASAPLAVPDVLCFHDCVFVTYVDIRGSFHK